VIVLHDRLPRELKLDRLLAGHRSCGSDGSHRNCTKKNGVTVLTPATPLTREVCGPILLALPLDVTAITNVAVPVTRTLAIVETDDVTATAGAPARTAIGDYNALPNLTAFTLTLAEAVRICGIVKARSAVADPIEHDKANVGLHARSRCRVVESLAVGLDIGGKRLEDFTGRKSGREKCETTSISLTRQRSFPSCR
jgi:hypothetical protein